MSDNCFFCHTETSIDNKLFYKDIEYLVCNQCFSKRFNKRNVGRQPIGITDKISLTLPKNVWLYIDGLEGTTSSKIRDLINGQKCNATNVIIGINKKNYENNYKKLETRKISLTMSLEFWEEIKKSEVKKSKLIRDYILLGKKFNK